VSDCVFEAELIDDGGGAPGAGCTDMGRLQPDLLAVIIIVIFIDIVLLKEHVRLFLRAAFPLLKPLGLLLLKADAFRVATSELTGASGAVGGLGGLRLGIRCVKVIRTTKHLIWLMSKDSISEKVLTSPYSFWIYLPQRHCHCRPSQAVPRAGAPRGVALPRCLACFCC
jgi:hypothetical protein